MHTHIARHIADRSSRAQTHVIYVVAMSLLFASSSTASRHIRRQLLSSNAPKICSGGNRIVAPPHRHFASKGKGLRRPKNNKPRAKSSKATPNNTANNVSSTQQQQKPLSIDPHSLANEMINMSAQGRTPGTEAIAKSLTPQQRWSNFAMAGGLLGFVSYIFYYSLASVGGVENAKALIFGSSTPKEENEESANPGFEEFLKEANEGRSVEEKRIKAEQDAVGEVRELVVLESSEGEEEIEMVRVAGFEVEGGEGVKQKRPLWKKIVFFWRRE